MRSSISGVKNSWQRVKSVTIVKSLKKCGFSNALDGSEYDILYEESDASSENSKPWFSYFVLVRILLLFEGKLNFLSLNSVSNVIINRCYSRTTDKEH
jgi:hypothetical protein